MEAGGKYRRPYKKSYPRKKVDPNAKLVTKGEVKRLVGRRIETKFTLSTHYFPAIDDVGTATADLTVIPSGAQQGQRVGRKVKLTKIVFKMEAFGSTSGLFVGPDQYNTLRVLLFRWKEDTNTAIPKVPLYTDILDNRSAANTYSTHWLYNYNNSDKFVVLYDKLVKVAPVPLWNSSTNSITFASAGEQYTHSLAGTMYGRKLGNKTLIFNDDSTGTSGNDKVWLMILSDSTTTPDPTCSFDAHIFYEDA